MPMLRKSFRIEKEIWDALVAEKQCPSRLIRLFILAGVYQMKIPHYDEILLLTKLEEQARKVGINTNQAVRAVNSQSEKSSSLKKKLCVICNERVVKFMRSGRKSTNFWQRIMATEQGHRNGTANGTNFRSLSYDKPIQFSKSRLFLL